MERVPPIWDVRFLGSDPNQKGFKKVSDIERVQNLEFDRLLAGSEVLYPSSLPFNSRGREGLLGLINKSLEYVVKPSLTFLYPNTRSQNGEFLGCFDKPRVRNKKISKGKIEKMRWFRNCYIMDQQGKRISKCKGEVAGHYFHNNYSPKRLIREYCKI